MTTKERIFDFAKGLEFHSGGKLQLVCNEEDDTSEPCMEAHTFLKLNGKRLGRDLELYNFMVTVSNVETVLATLLGELLIPCKSNKLFTSYSEGAIALKEWGAEVFTGELADDWIELF